MAYVNPYQDTMEYKPRTLWTRPERPRTDWSTFWGKAEEDGDDNGDDNGDGRGDETEVEKGAGSQLKSLWGDVMADMQSGYDLQQSQNMFDQFQPGITAVTPGTYNPNTATTVPNTQQYVGDWQNPDYTGGNTQPQVYNAGDLNAVTTGIPTPDTQGTALQAYQPSYNQQQQDLIDQSTQAYQQSYQNQPDTQATQAEIDAFNAQQQAYANNEFVGVGGLTPNQSALSYANAPTTTYGNTGATNPTIGEILNAEIEDEDEDIETGFWGGGSPHG